MSCPTPAVARRRFPRVTVLLVPVLGLLGVGAAWGYSAWHLAAARRAADGGQADRAWHHLQQARRTWPPGSDAHLLAARVARRLGKVEQARAHIADHERLGGDRAAQTLEVDLLLAQEGEWAGRDEALLGMVRAGHPATADILQALARGYLRTNHTAGLDRLLRLWPDDLASPRWRGRAHYHLGHFPEALADLAPCVAEDPDDDELRFELAQACYQSGRPVDALAHYRHLRDRRPTPDVLYWLAMCLQDQAQLHEAAAALDDLLARAPDHVPGLVERGRVAVRQSQPRPAEDWARRAVRLAPAAADAHLVLGLSLAAQGRAAEARGAHDRWQALDGAQYHLRQVMPVLAARPDDPDLHAQCGRCLLLLGNEDAALEAFDRALHLDPGHRPTHRLLADYHAGRGQPGRAAEHRERAAAP